MTRYRRGLLCIVEELRPRSTKKSCRWRQTWPSFVCLVGAAVLDLGMPTHLAFSKSQYGFNISHSLQAVWPRTDVRTAPRPLLCLRCTTVNNHVPIMCSGFRKRCVTTFSLYQRRCM